MSRRRKLLLGAAVLALLAAGIGRGIVSRRPAPPPAVDPAAAALELAPTDIVLVRPRELVHTVAVSGDLVAVNSAVVKARVAAVLKSVAVREGDRVQPGQVLAQLDPTEYDWKLQQAEQQARSAQAQLEIAQRTLHNSRSLVRQGFISATALETAVSNEAAAQAALQAAQAGVELARKARADTTVRAPIAGQIAERLVQPGERVPVDARLFEIVDPSRLELQAAIPPREAVALQVGAVATLQVDGLATPLAARVARINPSAQPGSRSVLAYLELPPDPALRQGLFARGVIELAHARVLALPLAAVRNDQAQPYALRIEGSRVVQRTLQLGSRGIEPGAPDEPLVEVVAGLADGDRVLAGSVGTVRSGTELRLPAAAAPAAAPAATAAPVAAAASAAR